jgi:hypothetical protein
MAVSHHSSVVAEYSCAAAFQKGEIDIGLLVSRDNPLTGACTGGIDQAADKEDGGHHPANKLMHSVSL